MRSIRLLLLAAGGLLLSLSAGVGTRTDAGVVSHPPMRPLPEGATRPLAAGPAYYVDGVRGDDSADGSQAKPWKTIRHGLQRLVPGDTLVMREGTYYESLQITQAGAADRPITLRAFPGERVVLDGGYREFAENPAQAWEPYPRGGAGEFRSVKAYPDLGSNPSPRRNVFVLGNFADSLVPLHGYNTILDLRADTTLADLDNNMTGAAGMYCGPGVWYDARTIGTDTYGTKRIHIRMAHTDLEYLGDGNYRGESDPRKVPLVIGGPRPVIRLEGARHVHIQDVALRGSSVTTLDVAGSEDIVLDGLTVYAGTPALRLSASHRVRIVNSAFRGVSAPWSSRYSEKYRGVSTYLLATDTRAEPGREIEIAFCEFTDCHDGLELQGLHSLRFHHNLVDNFNDDGIEPGPRKTERYIHVYQNRVSRCLLTFSLHGGRRPGEVPQSPPGSGVYIYRNVIDLRAPIHKNPPTAPGGEPVYGPIGVLCSDHGSPVWPVYYFYHNTVLYTQKPYRDFYGAGLGGHMYGTRRWVFNNIFTGTSVLPGLVFESPQADLVADGNLHWSLEAGAGVTGDFFQKLRASKLFEESRTRYAPGWAAQDIFADPGFVAAPPAWREPANLALRPGSPAKDAGVAVPQEWPDPLREHDPGRPDIGALPQGNDVWSIGVRGRYSLSGEQTGDGR